MVELLGAVAALAASFDGAGQLREMQNAKVRFGMAFAVMSEGASDSFRSDQAEIIQIIGPGGMRVIRIDDVAGERSTVLRNAVKVILVRERIEFGDEGAVLIERRFDDEDVDAALESGADHFTPFGFIARPARSAVAVARQETRAVSFLERALDFLRAKKRAVLRILDTV